MRKRVLIGMAMIVAGVALLAPDAWTVRSPFLLQLVTSNSSAGLTWVLIAIGGFSLLALGVRRMLPLKGPC